MPPKNTSLSVRPSFRLYLKAHCYSYDHVDILRQMEHLDMTIGPESSIPFHIDVVRNPLTQNIQPKFADIQDEISSAFADYIHTDKGNGEYISICRLIVDVA
jgi:hypothetical protein